MTVTPLDLLLSQAQVQKLTTRPVVSLSEGHEPRIIAGALAAHKAGIADVILVGTTDIVRAELRAQGADEGGGIAIHDPATSPLTEAFAAEYHDLRRHKGLDADAALKAAQTPLVYAAMMVRLGHATGTVGGAITATPDVVRTAIQVIGQASDANMVSSFFLMYPPKAAKDARALLFSDCALVIDPTVDELMSIAVASAKSCRALLLQEPKIAMLSFSTKGSARHDNVTKVSDATDKIRASYPDLNVDGEMQFDAAYMPNVGAVKAPGSGVAGHANVMIFPNLDAGNIGYKIAQRLGGYLSIGAILQGLAKPANDLSRGCTADDVTQMIAVTMLQASNIQASNIQAGKMIEK